MYAFNSNFLSMLISPVKEKPLDTAEDILEKGLIPIMKSGGFYENLLIDSPNLAMQKLVKRAIFTEEFQPTSMIVEKVLFERTHVWLTGYFHDSQNLFYEHFHRSQDVVPGTDPWYVWIVNKKWLHKEKLEKLILIFQQVYVIRVMTITKHFHRLDFLSGRKKFNKDGDEEDDQLIRREMKR